MVTYPDTVQNWRGNNDYNLFNYRRLDNRYAYLGINNYNHYRRCAILLQVPCISDKSDIR